MIIAISGDLGSGKSTIAKKLAEELGLPRYYMGSILRKTAKERGLTIGELMKEAEGDPSIDKDIDDYVKNLPEKEENFVIESRTAWFLIPNSLKIYLQVSQKEAAKRIFKEIKEGNERNEGGLKTFEEVLDSVKNRSLRDRDRYQKYYGVDITKEDNYDLVLDTTNLSKKEVYRKVLEFINKKRKS
ncbi:MAG: (d)CMP kinase [Patescibacteria group bacterium]